MKSGTAQEGILDRGQSRSPVVRPGTRARVRRSGRRHAYRDHCETKDVLKMRFGRATREPVCLLLYARRRSRDSLETWLEDRDDT